MDQYAPSIYADLDLATNLILTKARELIAIAQETSEPSSDLFTRVIKSMHILDKNTSVVGPAKQYIPRHIEKHFREESRHVLVVDPHPDALML